MKREELVEYSVVCIDDIPSDVRDEAINGCTSFFAFDAVDAEEVMGAYKQRIKDLEAENERLKAHVPVWHSVADGDLPKDDDADDGGFVLVDIHEMEDFPLPGTERVRVSEMYYENLAYDNENNCGIFVNMENLTPDFDKCWFTHWMPLPPPPTTEASSETESRSIRNESCIAKHRRRS